MGHCLSVGGNEGRVHLLDARSGKVVREVGGGLGENFEGAIMHHWWSTAENKVMLGTDKGVVSAWDVGSGELVWRFEAGPVKCINSHPVLPSLFAW